jgi:hypothetical protein
VCAQAYAFTQRATQPAALPDIADLYDPLDKQLPHSITSPSSRHAHRRWQQLKGAPAQW